MALVQTKLEEIARFKEMATKTEEALVKAHQEITQSKDDLASLREENAAKQKELDQLQHTLQEVRRGRTDGDYCSSF